MSSFQEILRTLTGPGPVRWHVLVAGPARGSRTAPSGDRRHGKGRVGLGAVLRSCDFGDEFCVAARCANDNKKTKVKP